MCTSSGARTFFSSCLKAFLRCLFLDTYTSEFSFAYGVSPDLWSRDRGEADPPELNEINECTKML